MRDDIYTPPQGPGQAPAPSREIFPAMGQENIYRMLEDFYRRLGESEINSLFPKGEENLMAAAHKSAAFFTGLLGGPPLYHQQFGPPRMRARHLPFPIDEAARQVWMRCFLETLENATEDYRFPAEHLDGFKTFLDGFSRWMVNKR